MFVARQVFCEALLSEQSNDTVGKLRMQNPARAVDLDKRLAGSGRENRIDTDNFFSELVIASDSHLFFTHLSDRLVWEIRALSGLALQVGFLALFSFMKNCNNTNIYYF